MKKIIIKTILLFSLLFFSFQIILADVCIIDEMKMSKITGIVLLPYKNPNQNPIPNAKIQLQKRKNKKTIQETKTNDKGWFEFLNIKEGKYTLIVSFPNTKTLFIPIKVLRRKSLAKNYLGITVDVTIGGCDEEVKILEK